METFERINQLLKINKMSKKEFSKKVLELEPKLKNTGEIPSLNTIYAYLNGRIGIKIELIPYIAEILGVPEQLLFDDSPHTRKTYFFKSSKQLFRRYTDSLILKVSLPKKFSSTARCKTQSFIN